MKINIFFEIDSTGLISANGALLSHIKINCKVPLNIFKLSMKPFSHLKRGSMESAEDASKRIKMDKTAIFCLQPAEIKRAAKSGCESQHFLARKLLWESMLEHDQLQKANSRPKNRIVEETLDQCLGHIMQSISEEIMAGVRDFFAARVYESVEKSCEFVKARDIRNIPHINFKNSQIDQLLTHKMVEKISLQKENEVIRSYIFEFGFNLIIVYSFN